MLISLILHRHMQPDRLDDVRQVRSIQVLLLLLARLDTCSTSFGREDI